MCCAPGGARTVVHFSLRRRAGRPQLKRDSLGGKQATKSRRAVSDKCYEVPSSLYSNDPGRLELQIEPSTSPRTQPRASPHNLRLDSVPPAARDSFIIVIPFRETCRMPVARGDESRDSFTVVRIPAQRRSAAAGLCHNPLFR